MNTTTKETFEQRWERVWKAIDACAKKPSEVRRLVTIDAATQNEVDPNAAHKAEFLADFEKKTKFEIHPFTPNRDKWTDEQREIADADHAHDETPDEEDDDTED